MKRLTTIMMALIITSLSGLAGSAVDHLRCKYLVNPEGIDVTRPCLSWEFSGNDEGGNLKLKGECDIVLVPVFAAIGRSRVET